MNTFRPPIKHNHSQLIWRGSIIINFWGCVRKCVWKERCGGERRIVSFLCRPVSSIKPTPVLLQKISEYLPCALNVGEILHCLNYCCNCWNIQNAYICATLYTILYSSDNFAEMKHVLHYWKSQWRFHCMTLMIKKANFGWFLETNKKQLKKYVWYSLVSSSHCHLFIRLISLCSFQCWNDHWLNEFSWLIF